MPKKLHSIFTDDLDTCYITGQTDGIERHHCFESRMNFKGKSEKYGFIVPLHRSVHPNGAWRTENTKDLDHWLKRKCQEWYLENIGTREQWYEEFGRFYDDRSDEKIWLNNKEYIGD